MHHDLRLVVLALLGVGAVVRLVLWARASQHRSSPPARPGGSEAPFDAEAAASRHNNNLGGGAGV